MFNPDTKPTKKEKISSKNFKIKYSKSNVKISNKTGIKKKPKKKKIYDYPAWRWFARYIKLIHCNSQGIVKCATSGRYFHVSSKNLHAGHYIKVYDGNSTNLSVAFHIINVMPQCRQDNVYAGGKQDIMMKSIIKIWGEDAFDDMVLISKSPAFLKQSDYTSLAKKYREKTYQLLKEKGIKKWWDRPDTYYDSKSEPDENRDFGYPNEF